MPQEGYPSLLCWQRCGCPFCSVNQKCTLHLCRFFFFLRKYRLLSVASTQKRIRKDLATFLQKWSNHKFAYMVFLVSTSLLTQAIYRFNKLSAHVFYLCIVLPPTSELCKLLPVYEAEMAVTYMPAFGLLKRPCSPSQECPAEGYHVQRTWM